MSFSFHKVVLNLLRNISIGTTAASNLKIFGEPGDEMAGSEKLPYALARLRVHCSKVAVFFRSGLYKVGPQIQFINGVMVPLQMA